MTSANTNGLVIDVDCAQLYAEVRDKIKSFVTDLPDLMSMM